MNPLSPGERSSVQPAKCGHGRPRKYPSPASSEAAHSVGLIEYLPQRSRAPEPKLGQPVTGFVEGAFDKGFLVSVQIGNSIMRGVVFKPEQSVPVTAENDVAPHLPMIKRKGKKWGFREFANQTASKRKLESESVGQILVNEVAPGMQQIDDGGGSSNADTIAVAQTLFHVEIDEGKEELEPSAQNGKTTEEDVNENEARICEESTSVTLAEFDEIMATKSDNTIESIVP